VYTRILYKIILVTNLNKYLHYGTSGTDVYIYIYIFVCIYKVQIAAVKNYEQKHCDFR
jgi:hypothetical protein